MERKTIVCGLAKRLDEALSIRVEEAGEEARSGIERGTVNTSPVAAFVGGSGGFTSESPLLHITPVILLTQMLYLIIAGGGSSTAWTDSFGNGRFG